MSFLADLFRKKDAAFYAEKARKALESEVWVDARDFAEDGLAKEPTAEIEKELRLTLREASRAICDMNREEANYSAEAGELERALDLLNVAMENAPSESIKRDIRREVDRLERRAVSRDRTRVAQEMGRRRTVGEQEVKPLLEEAEPEHAVADLFEVYIAGLVPEVAERYRSLGPDFMNAYVSLNQGEVKTALSLMRKVDAEESAKPYLNFERARVALMLGMAREARSLIETTIEHHGYAPLYLSGTPSIAQIAAEAALALDDDEGALEATRKGLSLETDNQNLQVLEVQLLTKAKRFDEGVRRIEKALAESPRNRDMFLLYYQLEMTRGRPDAAANALEQGMGRCCSGGKCGPQDREIPRSLIGHYLRVEQKAKRVDELLQQLFMSQNGDGEWIDLYLRARYYKWQGDDERGQKNWSAALQKCPEDEPRLAEVRALYAS